MGDRREEGIEEEIKIEKWKDYCMGLLGGVEIKQVEGGGRIGRDRNRRYRENNKKIESKEAAGEDNMGNEIWKYGG